MSRLEKLCEKGLEFLQHKRGIDTFELENKAAQLLTINAELSQTRLQLEYNLIKARSIERAEAARSMANSQGKTVTEKKLEFETDPPYVIAREALEKAEAEVSYIRTMYEIFTNGHIFFRNLLKDSNG